MLSSTGNCFNLDNPALIADHSRMSKSASVFSKAMAAHSPMVVNSSSRLCKRRQPLNPLAISSTILRPRFVLPSSSYSSPAYRPLRISAARIASDGDNWWEKNLPANFRDLHSTQEFVAALGDAGDKLVVVEFYGTWCGSCRALFPKLCKLAQENQDILFYKIDFDANKPLCKSLNIKMLPFFHFYRGAAGRLDAFSASLSKLQKIRDAIATHSTDRCELGPPAGPQQILHPETFPDLSASTTAPPPTAAAKA